MENLAQIKKHLRNAITEDLEKGLDEMEKVLSENSEVYSVSFLLQKAEYESIRKNDLEGIVAPGNLKAEYAQVRRALFAMVKNLTVAVLNESTHSKLDPGQDPPPPPPPKNRKPRLGIHHANTCNRIKQYDAFLNIIRQKESTNKKLHFFYLYGGKAQAHKGLFQRFVARLEGIDLDHINPNVNTITNTFSFEVGYPGLTNMDNLKKEVPRRLMAGFHMNEEEMKKIGEQNLTTVLERSPKLKGLTSSDQVCVLITIPERRWNKNLTPQMAKWFIEEFCGQGEQQTEMQKILGGDSPEFYFFFSISYKATNTSIKTEIDETLIDAKHTQTFQELSQVEYEDVEDWFEDYENMWEDDEATETALKTHFDEQVPMDMKIVQKKLEIIINHLNDSEKDGHRNS